MISVENDKINEVYNKKQSNYNHLLRYEFSGTCHRRVKELITEQDSFVNMHISLTRTQGKNKYDSSNKQILYYCNHNLLKNGSISPLTSKL